MREIWVRRIAILTGLLVLLLSATFAILQNPGDSESAAENKQPPPSYSLQTHLTLDPEQIKAGREIYNQQHCSSCHAIAGQGNPRSSLDDVGAKYTAEQLRNLVTGADTLRGVLSDRTLNLKQKYRTLAKDDLNALIIYLQSLQISNSSARVSG